MVKLKALIITIGLLFAGLNIYSQSIKLVRTDVDSVRSNFVTATYMFGVDVVIEGVANCNGVEFELTFDSTSCIHYSDWQTGGFGENATTVVIPIVKEGSNFGRVYALVISGDPINEAKITDTTVIHLDFVVSQKASHGGTLTFKFQNAHATINQNGIGEVVELLSEPFVYDIHGFVNVWPGDTDNNGLVDEVDMDLIALHLFHGAPTKMKRTFKRLNSSTLWHKQRVLAWDSAQVTYADCDGDANITAYDMMVIPLNFGETHTGSSVNKISNPRLQNQIARYNFKRPENSVAIPLYIDHKESYLAATIQLSWQDLPDGFKVLGFERGEIFETPESFLYADLNEEQKSATVVIGDYNKDNKANQSGNIIYIIVEPSIKEQSISGMNIIDLSAMSDLGYIFPLNHNLIMDVNEEEKRDDGDIKIIQLDDILNFTFPVEDEYAITLYNISGQTLYHQDGLNSLNKQITIDINNINTGAYYARIRSSKGIVTKPLMIIK